MSQQTPHETAPVALVVVGHHRSDSLTAAIAERAAERLRQAGYRIDLLQLQQEGFEPRNQVADEPQYDNPKPVYSAEVHALADRLHAADVVVPVFPVWWFGLPAVMKGWLDRVWNHGLTYGVKPEPMAGKRMLWIGLAGIPDHDPNADLVRFLLDNTLRRGLSEYCDVTDVHTLALFHSEGTGLTGDTRERHFQRFFERVDESVAKLLAG